MHNQATVSMSCTRALQHVPGPKNGVYRTPRWGMEGLQRSSQAGYVAAMVLDTMRHTKRIQIPLSSPENLPGLSRALLARILVDNVGLQVVPIPVLCGLKTGGRQHWVCPSRSLSGGVTTPTINRK